jgi:CheY-like chemotaxis protein
MPVMDGYRSTSYIRNSKTFASNARIQGTPIVAMTASAIQGDREKCQMAGSEYTVFHQSSTYFHLLTGSQ